MKHIILALCLLIAASALAQRNVEKQEQISKSESVYLNFKFANDIKVEQWNKNEVSIKASVYLDNGEGNDAFSLKTDRSSGVVKIYSDFGDYFEQKQKERKNWTGNRTTEINYVVYVPKGVSLRVKSISGSLEMNTFIGDLRTDLISGDITLKKYDGELRLKTVSGDVDVVIDKALIDASTVTGTIYSDLDIQQNSKKNYGTIQIKGSVNKGTEPLKLKTVSGDIYMRKG